MDYFYAFALFIFYKLIALVPLVLILISIIKLQRNGKSLGTRLMLTGNIGLIVKIVVIDSLMDYFIRFGSGGPGISNISSIYTIIGFIALSFSIIFATGFLIFINDFLKRSGL